MKWTELYRCVFAAFMVVWFFCPLKEETDCSPLRRTLYFVLLLCMAPIYVIPGGGEADHGKGAGQRRPAPASP